MYATTKAAVTTITECLWGQLREVESKVGASLMTAPEYLLTANLMATGEKKT